MGNLSYILNTFMDVMIYIVCIVPFVIILTFLLFNFWIYGIEFILFKIQLHKTKKIIKNLLFKIEEPSDFLIIDKIDDEIDSLIPHSLHRENFFIYKSNRKKINQIEMEIYNNDFKSSSLISLKRNNIINSILN